MSRRRLIAALACRAGGSRLYGKPLQNLDPKAGRTILDQIIANLKTHPAVEEIILGIAEGEENCAFIPVAERWGVRWLWGDRIDVLKRLIDCGRLAEGTDVFRVTTECPFPETSVLETAWAKHVERGNDVTATDGLPEGTHFELYQLSALETSHRLGGSDERSEFCSLYFRRHLEDFRVKVIEVPASWQRSDLRLTVDYPEDLIVCRQVYAALKHRAPCIPLQEIIPFLDSRPDLKQLVAPYVKPMRLWSRAPEAAASGRGGR